jgi:hypothetical protein
LSECAPKKETNYDQNVEKIKEQFIFEQSILEQIEKEKLEKKKFSLNNIGISPEFGRDFPLSSTD